MPKTQKTPKPQSAKKKDVATKEYVKRAVKGAQERKILYEYGDGVELTTTATFISLSDAISQGDSQTTREGDTVKMDYLKFNGELVRKASSTTKTEDHCRIILFQWLLADGTTAPNVSSVLYDASNLPYLSPTKNIEPQGKSLIHILWDKTFIINDSLREGSSKKFSVVIDGKKIKPLRYSAGTTQGQNMIYMMRLGDYVTGNDTTQLFYYVHGYFYE